MYMYMYMSILCMCLYMYMYVPGNPVSGGLMGGLGRLMGGLVGSWELDLMEVLLKLLVTVGGVLELILIVPPDLTVKRKREREKEREREREREREEKRERKINKI